ncbi:bifunctional diguanylate cyclase/phosphodiesterase [Shewanella gelidii]|uniref:Bifunctional diguanylate cyclase/phosphodiesterase n=1 Tax=Shewanella gelidii TaxID=1642821 RepID=A0A917JV34_9GAMM|nr:bifunctional diguanylate cyclase/phosphodiesterase [Shewanella gelidii]
MIGYQITLEGIEVETFNNQSVIESIVNSDAKQQGDYTQTAELASELLFEHLAVSQVSIWSFSQDQTLQYQVAQFGNQPSTGLCRPVHISALNKYCHELKISRIIAANSCLSDPRLDELVESYFKPNSIASSLDIAIRINGHLEGVLCIEREHYLTDWCDKEIQLASQVADQLALTIATREAYSKEEQLSLFKSSAEQADHITMLVNLHSETVEYVNAAHNKITGVAKEKIINKPISALDFFKQHPKAASRAMANLLRGESTRGEAKLQRYDGADYWLKYHASPFVTDRGNHYVLMTGEDCTEQHNHQQELETLAWKCNLTGLCNRTRFNRVLEKTKEGQLFSIDLIGFKRFNDTYGHRQGDALLVELARRLTHFNWFGQNAEIARVGSDEFAVLLHHPFEDLETELLVNRLYQTLIAPVLIGREQIHPKPSIAVVNVASVAELVAPMTCADIALQQAKTKVGRPIQFFTRQLLNTFKENAQIERDLQTAIKGRQLELYYQPLKDLQSNTFIGAEALIRWHHPKRGVLYPGSFIDIAEQTGQINAIGSWVLEAACRQLNLWQHQQSGLVMHVNVSARQFFSGNLFEQVWQLLTRYRLKPNTLILEITETELMEDIKSATNLCHELADLGVGLAIDDFGTGYSSMRYLKQFPISKLKIDRSFISDLTVSRESQEIVSAIIAMASALNISLTAEGVETREQEDFLASHRCHHAQGYLYSPAIRQADFENFIQNK